MHQQHEWIDDVVARWPAVSIPGNGCVQTLVNGDALSVLDSMPKESVGCIITSPPYNLNIEYNSYDDKRPEAEYLRWVADWLKKLKPLKKGKSDA